MSGVPTGNTKQKAHDTKISWCLAFPYPPRHCHLTFGTHGLAWLYCIYTNIWGHAVVLQAVSVRSWTLWFMPLSLLFSSLSGHEQPFSIQLSHDRDAAEDSTDPNKCQFILRENKKQMKIGMCDSLMFLPPINHLIITILSWVVSKIMGSEGTMVTMLPNVWSLDGWDCFAILEGLCSDHILLCNNQYKCLSL